MNKSTTKIIFISGSVICLTKLALGGLTVGSFNLAIWPASEFALAFGTISAMYVGRRVSGVHQDEEKK